MADHTLTPEQHDRLLRAIHRSADRTDRPSAEVVEELIRLLDSESDRDLD